jgi:hypothetical protein
MEQKINGKELVLEAIKALLPDELKQYGEDIFSFIFITSSNTDNFITVRFMHLPIRVREEIKQIVGWTDDSKKLDSINGEVTMHTLSKQVDNVRWEIFWIEGLE